MQLSLSKDYPDFYHLDTLVKTPQPKGSSENPYFPPLYSPQRLRCPSLSLKKTSNKSSKFNTERSEINQLPSLHVKASSCDALTTAALREKIKAKIQKARPFSKYFKSNDEMLEVNIAKRTKEFMKYLSMLSLNNPLIRNSQIKTPLKKNESVAFKQSLTNAPSVYSFTPKEKPALPPKKLNTQKPAFRARKSNEKKGSVLARLSIPSYHELREQIRRLQANLTELKEIVHNAKKVYGVIKGFMCYRSPLLSRILLNEEGECLCEPLLESMIEDKCFIREVLFEGAGLSFREKLDPAVLSDIRELNEKLEAYNTSHEIEKIRIMESEVIQEFHQVRTIEEKLREMRNRKMIFRDYKPVEKFNYKQIPPTRLVEELDIFEKSLGGCEFIQNRSRLICKAIENSVRNVQSECEN